MEGERQPQAEGQDQKVSVESLMAEIQSLKVSKERILEESKGYKNKFQEASTTLSTIEREKLEKEGKTEEILLNEREEKAKLLDDLSNLKAKTLKANVRSMLSKHAKDAHSIDDLLSLKQASTIEYDEDSLEPLVDTVSSFVTSVREEKPYLFGSKQIAPMADGKPKDVKAAPRKKTLEEALSGLV